MIAFQITNYKLKITNQRQPITPELLPFGTGSLAPQLPQGEKEKAFLSLIYNFCFYVAVIAMTDLEVFRGTQLRIKDS